jgi:hypothetical protein
MLLFHARRLRFVREDNPPTSNLSVGTLYSMLDPVTIGDMTESGQRKGTREMNALIVGRAITGFSAFVQALQNF